MSFPAPRQAPWPSGRSSSPAGAAGSSPGRPRQWGGGGAGERPPPSVKTGKARWWGSSLHLAPPSPPRQHPFPRSSSISASQSLSRSGLLSPRPACWSVWLQASGSGRGSGTTRGLRGLGEMVPLGALPSPYLKISLRSPSSAGLSAQSQAARVTYSMSVSSANRLQRFPHEQPDPGRQSLCRLDAARPCGRPLPTQPGFRGGWAPSAEPKVVQNLHLQELAPGRH